MIDPQSTPCLCDGLSPQDIDRNPGMIVNRLPPTLSEILKSRDTAIAFVVRALQVLQQTVNGPQSPEVFFTAEQISRAEQNYQILGGLYRQATLSGLVDPQLYSNPLIVSPVASALAEQIDAEETLARNYSRIIAGEIILELTARFEERMKLFESQISSVGLTPEQMSLLLETSRGVFGLNQDDFNIIIEAALANSKIQLQGLLSQRRPQIIGLLSSLYVDPRPHFDPLMPNRRFAIAWLMDEIVRKIISNTPVEELLYIGRADGDIGGLTIANNHSKERHQSGNLYLRAMVDMQTKGIVKMLLTALGVDFFTSSEGGDESGQQIISTGREGVGPAVETLVEVINELWLEEAGLYRSDHILNFKDIGLRRTIAGILANDDGTLKEGLIDESGLYIPREGEEFAMMVSVAGCSIYRALTMVDFREITNLNRALQIVAGAAIDYADMQGKVAKEKAKEKVSADSPANRALLSTQRLFDRVVDLLAQNQELRQALGRVWYGRAGELVQLDAFTLDRLRLILDTAQQNILDVLARSNSAGK